MSIYDTMQSITAPCQGRHSFETPSEVEARFRHATDLFENLERDLFRHEVNERSITDKLAEHLQVEFRSFHVDCSKGRGRRRGLRA